MEYDKLRELLNKYFEGDTALEEEAILRNYFSEEEALHPDFIFAREFFLHWTESRQVEYKDSHHDKKNIAIKKRNRLGWLAIAASVCLLVIAVLFWPVQQQTVYAYINGQPITDKEVALAEMEKALEQVSQGLNRGTSELKRISKFEEIEGRIFKRE